MKRPFFFDRIERLEALVADPGTSQSCLQEIAKELAFRSTHRARKLANKLKDHKARLPLHEKETGAIFSGSLGAKISALPLSTRAQNALAALNVSVVGELCRLSEAELLRTRNVGRKTINELRRLLQSFGLRFGVDVSPHEALHDPSAQIELPMELRIKEPCDLAGSLRAHVDAVSSCERNAGWVIEHLGWDGLPHRTLEAIGERFNVTRERVRQVVAKCIRHLQAKEVVPAALTRTIELIATNAPMAQFSVDQLLRQHRLANEGFCIDSIKRAARVFGADFPYEVREGINLLIIPTKHSGLPELLARSAKIEIAGHGAIVDDQLAEVCRTIAGRSVDLSFAHAVLLSEGSFQRLPECQDWWWRPSVAARGRNRLVNTIKKIVAACPEIRFADLREACRRHVRSDHIAPPTRVLRAICSSLPFLRVRGDFVGAIPQNLNWDEVLNPSEKLLLQIFDRSEILLDSYTVSQRGISLGINENSLTIYKTYSPLLWRPVAGYYSKVGSEIPVGLIEELQRKKIFQSKTTLDFGWTNDHRILIAKRLTDGVWLSGIMSLPSALRRFVTEDFSLFAFGKQRLGSITILEGNVFGLKTFLRMFGGDPGDVLVLLFDSQNKRCDIWLGGNDLSGIIQAGPDSIVSYLSGAPHPEVIH